MRIFDAFRTPKDNSAAIAADRLRILINHERNLRNGTLAPMPDYVPLMREEMVQSLRVIYYKYHKTDMADIDIDVNDHANGSMLSITFPLNN